MPSRIVEPSAANTITTTQEMPFIIFPPFPTPPPGVTLIPFKDFRPRGIQLFSEATGGLDEEGMELDGMGIPTVELRVKHSTDECKSNTRKRKRKKKTATADGIPAKKLPWYEEWEEGEDLRITKERFDSNVSAVDRFFHAANDFRVNRTWPPVTSGVNQLWDQFRLYVGLLVNPTIYRKPARGDQDGSPDIDGDGDGPSDIQTNKEDTSGQVPSSKNRVRTAYSAELDDDDDDDEDTFRAPKTETEEQREEKLVIFLNDPEKSVTIFLSSYMREQGLIWSERNLINAPHLLSFFLNFILRNRVLPRASHESGIRRALDIIELAKKELPLTYKIGQALPDAFSDGCKECFDRKGGIEWSFEARPKADDPPVPVDQTIIVIDQDGAETGIVLPDTEETALKDVLEDNLDMEIQVTGMQTAAPVTNATATAPIADAIATASPDILSASTADTAAGGWDAMEDTDSWGYVGSDGWGTIDEDGRWAPAGDNDEWGANSAPLSFAPEVTEPSWLSPPPALISLMGPTAFPLTHTTGIVESSTRRIKAIHPPPKDKAKIKGDSAEMVEDELERRFARIVMGPWGREECDIPSPSIRKTSRGAVVMPNGEVEGDGPGKPHNPYEDDIVLVVEPSVLNKLSLGMGLGGLWVQIVREEVEADLTNGQEQNKSRGKRSKKGPLDELSGNYWYLEELMGIFPSYFVSREDAK